MLKPPLTYEQQVQHLKDQHKLTILNDDIAKDILSKVNYYRLMGYGIGLTDTSNHEVYKEGVTLEYIFKLYCFDSQLRNNLTRTLEQIEVQLRTQIANRLAIKYGAEGYRNVNNFSDNISNKKGSIHQYTLKKIDDMLLKHRSSPEVNHHLKKYKKHFPIWVVIEFCTFGNLSSIFEILKTEDKDYISSLYDTHRDFLGNWIRLLVEIRNRCAHYNRIYNKPFQTTPRLYKEHQQYIKDKPPRLFGILLVIKRMLKSNEQWESLYKDLCSTFKKYEGIPNLSFIGFPADWQDVLKKE